MVCMFENANRRPHRQNRHRQITWWQNGIHKASITSAIHVFCMRLLCMNKKNLQRKATWYESSNVSIIMWYTIDMYGECTFLLLLCPFFQNLNRKKKRNGNRNEKNGLNIFVIDVNIFISRHETLKHSVPRNEEHQKCKGTICESIKKL